jgi:CheY-like chemotaxis protein
MNQDMSDQTQSNAPVQPRPARKVLVVDDNRDSATALSMLLGLMGYEVLAAYDGKSALEAVADFKPHIVLLDLGMPVMDGYEVCRTIRQSPEGRRLAIIAQSGWGQDSDRQLTKEAGFDHHLVKPIPTDELLSTLARFEN